MKSFKDSHGSHKIISIEILIFFSLNLTIKFLNLSKFKFLQEFLFHTKLVLCSQICIL